MDQATKAYCTKQGIDIAYLDDEAEASKPEVKGMKPPAAKNKIKSVASPDTTGPYKRKKFVLVDSSKRKKNEVASEPVQEARLKKKKKTEADIGSGSCESSNIVLPPPQIVWSEITTIDELDDIPIDKEKVYEDDGIVKETEKDKEDKTTMKTRTTVMTHQMLNH
ncbi:hypothetical protein LINPERPRIM_LOCUS20768 [Linum perenne]